MQQFSIKMPFGLLEYTVTHRPRVKKRLHMELDESGGLVIVAPRHWSKKHIDTTLSQNTHRLERFLVRARSQQSKPLKYIHGEKQLYLGRYYPLKILTLGARQTRVVFTGQEIQIKIRKNSKADVRVILQRWYRQQAQKVLTERFQLIKEMTPWARERTIELKLRKMKRTWGNCSSKGLIKLNIHLIRAGIPVIDSVIAHELCHLEEMNHGARFYVLLESLNPNWRRDRDRLRAEANDYLL